MFMDLVFLLLFQKAIQVEGVKLNRTADQASEELSSPPRALCTPGGHRPVSLPMGKPAPQPDKRL